MAETQSKQWGVTAPISTSQPTPGDLKLNDELVEELTRQNVFESHEGSDMRVRVLRHIQEAVDKFCKHVGKLKGLPQSTIDTMSGKIFCFGSYALGVHGPSSDIDTLIVAPKSVSLNDYFDHFERIFREMSDEKLITEMNPVPEAFVPLIKMEYSGVSIDLLFVSLPSMTQIPKDLEGVDKNMLRGLDDTAMRSVNGTRVTLELMQSIPQIKSFRHALRAIKLWSTQRGIYGAVFGYPGGIAWAIMVARICQLYPMACGATILTKFFRLMGKWPFPRPVMLKNIEEGTLNLRVWNPTQYPGDRAHLMPIITPAFPSMCSTHTIMHSTLHVLREEFERADQLINSESGILEGKKQWRDLFTKHTFFTKDHKYYLSVIAASRTEKAHSTFSGLVQSKFRLLCKNIEDGQCGIDIARPWMKGISRVHRYNNEEEADKIIQGHTDFQIKASEVPEIAPGEDSPAGIMYTTTFYVGLKLKPDGTKSLDISYPVSDFRNLVTTNNGFNEKLNSVRVIHTRNNQLPDDLFSEGETKAPKPSKKGKKGDVNKAAKRHFAETGLDVRITRITKTSRRILTAQEQLTRSG
ncbi:Poly(A) polymerase [Didymella exigua CBS 183.55]|uniref:Poly(A) polymerase n=1 Tax=Didymella exigua CBS 183.55 TaxID=1150837 RepID=A0A6A5RHV7_9PLEO|nr:Poly(A) polymerase [Didymella exigua CBS 183.55]KAF1927149.1 Poly(A) polymerase [Didymella exigua CBS 183.55]